MFNPWSNPHIIKSLSIIKNNFQSSLKEQPAFLLDSGDQQRGGGGGQAPSSRCPGASVCGRPGSRVSPTCPLPEGSHTASRCPGPPAAG